MTDAPPIPIIIDDREADSACAAALAELPGTVILQQRLRTGDYEIDGALVVERKTLRDFAQSILDGRVFRQATRLTRLKWPRRGVVLLEGTAADLSCCPLPRRALQGALVSLSLISGLPVLRALTPEESAQLMLYAARQVRQAQRGFRYRQGWRPASKRQRQLHLLEGLPGIGRERAERLLDHFGNVERIVLADAEELAEVPGIGRQTAAAVRDVLAEAPAPYGVPFEALW